MKKLLEIMQRSLGLVMTTPSLLFLILFFYLFFDRAGSCLDTGGVWDGDEKRCRKDCLTWNEVNGCIHMDEEYQKLFAACADKTSECDQNRLALLHKGLCKKYHAPLNLEHGYCDFEFEPKDCFKLEGNWEYPDICKKTGLN